MARARATGAADGDEGTVSWSFEAIGLGMETGLAGCEIEGGNSAGVMDAAEGCASRAVDGPDVADNVTPGFAK